jgi:hypothetical protein
MEAIFVTGIVFLAVYKIIELFVLHKGRKMLIEKMSQISSEDLQSNLSSLHAIQFNKMKGAQFSTLRIGALALGIGIGWLVGSFFTLIGSDVFEGLDWHYSSYLDSIPVATTALCAGLALIIVYFIERKAYKGKKAE